jgi:hypothetical protein
MMVSFSDEATLLASERVKGPDVFAVWAAGVPMHQMASARQRVR